MSVPTLGNATANATFLPNRRGIMKRDNKLRAKAHRMALESVQGDVDTGAPLSMQFSRGQKVDLKKLRQEAARSEYVEKCNRKLVDKMMMIMQGLCGTIVSEQTFPDFNPGTLNYRIRQRELLRIDRANSTLLHRLETASSGYNKALVKPKHFQEPHMGLFPRSANSVKSAGSRSGKRTRLLGSSTAPSGGGTVTSGRVRGRGSRQLGWDTSVTSVLTDDSAFPTTTLGKFQDASSSGGILGPSPPRQEGGEREATELRSGSPGGPDGGGSVDTVGGRPRIPHPPSVSSRATCGSVSGKTPSTLKRCRRLAKATPAKPGTTVFQGGIRVGEEHALLTVTRAADGFGEDGSQGFRLKAYLPLSLAVYTLGVAAEQLPAFTAGSRTAVRQLFLSGEKSRRKWETVATHLELRPWGDSSMQNLAEEAKRAAEPKPDSHRRADHVGGERSTAMQAAAAAAASETPPAETAAAAVSLGGLEGAEEKGVEATATQAAEAVAAETATAMGPGARRFEMVLVPPDDAHVITIQRLIRGMLMRSTYKTLKRAVLIIQAAVRAWKYRIAKWQYEAATKIAAVSRGKLGRKRAKQERAARGIQKHTRAWLRKRNLEREKAAKQIQGAMRRRNEILRREKTHISEEESLLLYEQPTPQTTTATRGGGGASGRRNVNKNRPAYQNNKRRTPGFSKAPNHSGGSTSRSNGRNRRIPNDGGIGGGGGQGAGTAVNKTTAPVGGGMGGDSHWRGDQDPGRRAPGNPEKVAASGDGQHDPQSGSSGGPAHERGTKSTPAGPGNGMKGGGGGGGRGGGSGVAGAAACTPPRNQRPRPPDAKDFTRSPYNRSAGGWTRGRGGGGMHASKTSPPADRPSAEPRKDTHDGEGSMAGRKDEPRGDAPAGGFSVAPPPLPKSSAAAPRVAGAWPSGGAGTRTAEAANAGAAGTTTTTTTTPTAVEGASLATGTSKPALASPKGSGKSSPRSASAGSKGRVRTPPAAGAKVKGGDAGGGDVGGGDRRGVESASVAVNEEESPASGGKQSGKPAPEQTPDVPSQKVTDEKSSNNIDDGSGGNSTTPTRQHRSSSIPWVEEAATGKNYQPPSPSKATIEPAADALAGSTSPEAAARKPGDNPPVGLGQQDGGNTTSGSAPKGTAQTKPTSAPQEVVESAASNQTGETATREAVVTGSRGASSDSSGRENSTPHRRTSSVSWAEDLVAEVGESGSSSSTKEEAVTASRPADSKGDGGGGDGGGDNNTRHRRTSSVSWAEDIAAGVGESGASSSTKEADVTASRGADSNGDGGGGDGGGDNNTRHRRTSSVSWAEDIVAGKGESGASPSTKEATVTASRGADSKGDGGGGDGGGGDGGGDNNTRHRRTSSVSWAEDIVARTEQEAVHPRESAAT